MPANHLNMTQAVVNIFNFCIGVGLLVKPYAFALCGVFSFPAMLLAAILCIYTGSVLGKVASKYSNKIIANQRQQEPLKQINIPSSTTMTYTGDIIYDSKAQETSTSLQPKQTANSKSIYPSLAKLSLYIHNYPKFAILGTNYVKFSLFCCQSSTIINFIIINWTLLQDIVHYFILTDNMFLGETALFAYTSILMISTFLLLSWDGMLFVIASFVDITPCNYKGITWLSWISALSVLVISISMIIFALISLIHYGGSVPVTILDDKKYIQLDANTAGIAAESMSALESIAVAFSLFVMGITAHSVLPLVFVDLNADLHTEKQWNIILLLSFGGSALFYTIIGAIGGWLYGYYTNIVILHNIFEWPGGIITPLISCVFS